MSAPWIAVSLPRLTLITRVVKVGLQPGDGLGLTRHTAEIYEFHASILSLRLNNIVLVYGEGACSP